LSLAMDMPATPTGVGGALSPDPGEWNRTRSMIS
jgi:hypothetical protein